jgi:trimeric autotransporter adhesin
VSDLICRLKPGGDRSGPSGCSPSLSSSNNIAVGAKARYNLTTGSDNIDIGNVGVAGESSTTRIGLGQTRTFIAGIRGRTTGNANAMPVLINSAGQLGTVSSSRRFKKEIKPMDQTSEAILALKPVTFHYKSDATGIPQFGCQR